MTDYVSIIIIVLNDIFSDPNKVTRSYSALTRFFAHHLDPEETSIGIHTYFHTISVSGLAPVSPSQFGFVNFDKSAPVPSQTAGSKDGRETELFFTRYNPETASNTSAKGLVLFASAPFAHFVNVRFSHRYQLL
jgi:hypothetical protein